MKHAIDSGHLLRSARERAGLSQRELARRAQTARSVIARIELGLAKPAVGSGLLFH
jgi:ribosome-binding protein aMBF1 (putative translation factor)